MPNATREAVIRFREETLPASDPSHGTPNAVVRRSLDFELPQGTGRWEQTLQRSPLTGSSPTAAIFTPCSASSAIGA